MKCWLCGKNAYFAWTGRVGSDKELTQVQHTDGSRCESFDKPEFRVKPDKEKNPKQCELFK